MTGKPSLLVIVPVHADAAVSPMFHRAIGGGRSALGRTIDYAKGINRGLLSRLEVAVATDDGQTQAYCRGESDVLLPTRRAQGLNAALAEALQVSEAQVGQTFDVVMVLEPPHPFRPRRLAENALAMLMQDAALDSVVSAERLTGRIWAGDGSHQPIADSFGRSGAIPNETFREVVGLMLVARREVVLRGERVGQRTGLLVVDRMWGYVDLRNERGWKVAEALGPTLLGL